MAKISLYASSGLFAALTALLACGSSGDAAGAGASSGSSGPGSSGGATGGLLGSSGGNGDGGAPGSSGGSGTSGGINAGCAKSSSKAQKVPVDMIIGLDTSHSMDFDDKWPNVRDALKVFVGDVPPSGLQLGLQYFPLRKQCSVPDYANPAVALMPAQQAAAPISTSLDAQQMDGDTPMVPLLQGLTQYLVTNSQPGRKQIIVLTTDGIPDQPANTCIGGPFPNTLDNAVVAAGNALAGTPSITTFVIGVGNELDALNAVAAAGGTTAATLIQTGGSASVQDSLIKALNGIRRSAIPCDFDIPAGQIDVNQTNVTYTPGTGATLPLVYAGDETGCAKAQDQEAWYFDDPANPKKVILCKGLCDAVRQDDSGSVDLVYGCPRADVK